MTTNVSGSPWEFYSQQWLRFIWWVNILVSFEVIREYLPLLHHPYSHYNLPLNMHLFGKPFIVIFFKGIRCVKNNHLQVDFIYKRISITPSLQCFFYSKPRSFLCLRILTIHDNLIYLNATNKGLTMVCSTYYKAYNQKGTYNKHIFAPKVDMIYNYLD